jgi:hypothetical protein
LTKKQLREIVIPDRSHHGGRLSNTRHEYEVYAWEGEDEDPAFQPLTLGKLVAKFIIPTK